MSWASASCSCCESLHLPGEVAQKGLDELLVPAELIGIGAGIVDAADVVEVGIRGKSREHGAHVLIPAIDVQVRDVVLDVDVDLSLQQVRQVLQLHDVQEGVAVDAHAAQQRGDRVHRALLRKAGILGRVVDVADGAVAGVGRAVLAVVLHQDARVLGDGDQVDLPVRIAHQDVQRGQEGIPIPVVGDRADEQGADALVAQDRTARKLHSLGFRRRGRVFRFGRSAPGEEKQAQQRRKE